MVEIWPMMTPISLITATDSAVAPYMPRNVRGNLVGRLRSLTRQRLHFAGDHCKAAAGSPARAALTVAFNAMRPSLRPGSASSV
jgi:hypothetical protein